MKNIKHGGLVIMINDYSTSTCTRITVLYTISSTVSLCALSTTATSLYFNIECTYCTCTVLYCIVTFQHISELTATRRR